MTDNGRRAGLAGPVILIGLGLFFLLSNLKIIDWGFWDIIRLWPVVLIVIGIDLIFSRRFSGGLLALTVIVLVVITPLVFIADAETFTSERIEQPLAGVQTALINLGSGIGILDLRAAAAGEDFLIAGDIAVGRRERIDRHFEVVDGEAQFTLTSEGWRGWPFIRGERNNRWELQLNPEIPLVLNIDTGVGRSTLDFSGLRVKKIHLQTGIGQTHLIMPASGGIEAVIDGGIGEAAIIIPAGAAARIKVQSGLGSVDVRGDFKVSDHTYTTDDYDQADDPIEVEIKGGIGRIIIEQG